MTTTAPLLLDAETTYEFDASSGTWTVYCGGCEAVVERGYITLQAAVEDAAAFLFTGNLARTCAPEDS